MNTRRDIHSLTDFKHMTPEFGERLKKSGDPIVDLAAEAKVLEGIRRGLEDMRAGRTHSIAEAFEDVRRELNLQPPS